MMTCATAESGAKAAPQERCARLFGLRRCNHGRKNFHPGDGHCLAMGCRCRGYVDPDTVEQPELCAVADR